MLNSKASIVAVVILFANSALSLHSQSIDVERDFRQAHVERPSDPPTKVDPQTVVAVPPSLVQFGGFISTQVNVDKNGNNIVGDAANEPSLTMNPQNPDNMVIGWRQFDSITSNFRQAGVGSTFDGGQTWNNMGPLDAGVFRSDPVLDSDSTGRIFYYSLSTNDTFDEFFCDMFISEDGGVTWTDPIPAQGGDKQWIAIDRNGGPGDGFIYAMWNSFFSCCPSGYFTRSTDNGLNYLQPIDTPPAIFWGTMDVGPDGELYICGRDSGNLAGVIRSDNAQFSDVTPTFPQAVAIDLGGVNPFSEGPNPGGLLGQYDVATDHSNGPNRGNVYYLGTVRGADNTDPSDIMFARSLDGGINWEPAVRINADPPAAGKYNWFGTMSVAPCGRIDVIWNDMRDDTDGTMSALYYSFSDDAGVSWSDNVQVSPAFNSLIGHPNQNKIGDYYDMRSTDDAVHIAYSATFNGEQDVFYLQIPATPGILIGDTNHDGEVNLLDVAPFVQVLSKAGFLCEADINQDGFVNLLDVEPFVELLSGN